MSQSAGLDVSKRKISCPSRDFFCILLYCLYVFRNCFFLSFSFFGCPAFCIYLQHLQLSLVFCFYLIRICFFVLDCHVFCLFSVLTTNNTNIYAPAGIRTRNPSKRSAADPRLRPLGHWDRQPAQLITNSTCTFLQTMFGLSTTVRPTFPVSSRLPVEISHLLRDESSLFIILPGDELLHWSHRTPLPLSPAICPTV